jgi:hypothetical protein
MPSRTSLPTISACLTISDQTPHCPSGQRELEREVDAFPGLMQGAHVDHAIVVLARYLILSIAEIVNQNGLGSAEDN